MKAARRAGTLRNRFEIASSPLRLTFDLEKTLIYDCKMKCNVDDDHVRNSDLDCIQECK